MASPARPSSSWPGPAGSRFTRRAIRPEELGKFEAAFVTGTAAEITAISSIDTLEYQASLLTAQLVEDYSILARRAG